MCGSCTAHTSRCHTLWLCSGERSNADDAENRLSGQCRSLSRSAAGNTAAEKRAGAWPCAAAATVRAYTGKIAAAEKTSRGGLPVQACARPLHVWDETPFTGCEAGGAPALVPRVYFHSAHIGASRRISAALGASRLS